LPRTNRLGRCRPAGATGNLEEAAGLQSYPGEAGLLSCAVCQEISYAVRSSTASKTVTEWRALAQATRHARVPGDWVIKGSGSSVGRPLVRFQSPWLDPGEDSYIQVEAGNNYDLPTASVMAAAQTTSKDKIIFPDRLWQALVAGCLSRPPRRHHRRQHRRPGRQRTGRYRRSAQWRPGSLLPRLQPPRLAPGEDVRCTSTATTPHCSPPPSSRASLCSRPPTGHCKVMSAADHT
jgi:hypothetical protein